MTTLAPVRFSPVLPAFRKIRKAGVSSALNWSTSSRTLLLGRGAGDEGVVAQALRVETFGDQIKEAGELGEDQRLLAFVHDRFPPVR